MIMKNEICTAALKNDMLLLINSGISKNDIEGAAGISLAQLNDPDEMVNLKSDADALSDSEDLLKVARARTEEIVS